MVYKLLRVLFISAVLLQASAITGQNWSQVEKVLPPVDPISPIGGQSDRVGWAVAVDGDLMVVGAPDSDVNGTSSGAAFVYERLEGSWQYISQLTASTGSVNDIFGWSVDVSGSRIIIGAPGDSFSGTSSGSVFIYEKVGGIWTETGLIHQADPASFDQFGYSVSISGDRILASSFEDDDSGFSSGSAYIFEFNGTGWMQTAKMIASDGAANDYFGISVSLEDSVAVCGAYLGNAGGTDRGAAYVFYEQDGLWSQHQKLVAPDAANSDQFGISVSVSGDKIVVGANYEDDGGGNAGAVYAFNLTGSNFEFAQKIVAPDAAANDFFGQGVNLRGNDLIIGAYANDDLGSASGSAYIYTFGINWSLQQKILSPDGTAQDYFGFSVDISGDEVVVGARGDDDSGNDSGSIYIFSRTGSSWGFVFKGAANDMIDDPSLDLFGSHVAIDGFNAVIGSYGDDDQGVSSGSVRFYRFDGNSWVDQGKFYSSDISQEDFFGFRVAISGNTALVSSYGDDDLGDFSGAVYVFERIGEVWTQTQKLISSDAAPFDDFGYSLSIDGDFAVISSYLDDDFGNFSGSAYVFQKVAGTWVQQQKLLPNSGAANQQFGFDVDINGTQIIIGARNDGTSVSFGGAAYIYEFDGSTWSQTAKIKPNDNSANKVFGSSVSISDGIALVGALGDNSGAASSGAAYVFEKVAGTWTQQIKLKPDTIIASEYFGYSVDNNGNKLLIGAYRGKNSNAVAAGSAFIFDGSSGAYVQTQKLTADDGALSDYFGIHVALDGKNALIGAQFDDDNGENAGSAYFFADCTDLDNNGVCDFAETTITNNECANATLIVPSVFGTSTWIEQPLFGATESAVGCVGVADDDVWFKFTAQSPNDIVLGQDPSGAYNVAIELYETCESAAMLCSDSYGAGLIERGLSGTLVPGQEYYYRVYDTGIASDSEAMVRTQVKTFEDCQLRAPFCGATNLQLVNSIYCERDDIGELYANPGVGVYGYGFRFQEQGGPLDVTVQLPFTNGFYLQLTNVPGLEYGKTYDVSVQHLVGLSANGTVGNYWSDFGTVCTVTLQPSIPLTSVRTEFCQGLTDFYLSDQLLAYQVSGADRYRFTFTGMGGSENGLTYQKESANYTVFLYNVGLPGSGLKYGNTYGVTVQSRINGLWSSSGTTCMINMAVQPEDTEVRAQFCNGTYLFPQSNYLLAETVLGANQYEWKFTPTAGGLPLTDITAGVSLAFHLTSMNLMPGVTYDVSVRAMAGGVWGDYASSCPVTIQGVPGIGSPDLTVLAKTIEKFEMKIYPNPASGEDVVLSVELKDEVGRLQVELIDMTGKVLHSDSFAVKGAQVNHRLHLGNVVAPGYYSIRVFSEKMNLTLPFIKE